MALWASCTAAADGTVYQNLANAFNGITGYSFLVFNLLCAPCFAAIGAIKREMNNAKWTWFAIGYQCGFAYIIALMINQFGNLFTRTRQRDRPDLRSGCSGRYAVHAVQALQGSHQAF